MAVSFYTLLTRFLPRDLPSRPFPASAGGGTCLQSTQSSRFSTAIRTVPARKERLHRCPVAKNPCRPNAPSAP